MKKISLAVFAMMMVAMLAVFAGCSSSSDTRQFFTKCFGQGYFGTGIGRQLPTNGLP